MLQYAVILPSKLFVRLSYREMSQNKNYSWTNSQKRKPEKEKTKINKK